MTGVQTCALPISTQTLTNKTLTTPNINSAQIATVSGTAPLYMCRAWVNFNGTGTVAIRGSGNVSSITDNGTGSYTVNFTTAMPDVNYAGVVSGGFSGNVAGRTTIVNGAPAVDAPTTSAFRIRFYNGTAEEDVVYASLAIFR